MAKQPFLKGLLQNPLLDSCPYLRSQNTLQSVLYLSYNHRIATNVEVSCFLPQFSPQSFLAVSKMVLNSHLLFVTWNNVQDIQNSFLQCLLGYLDEQLSAAVIR